MDDTNNALELVRRHLADQPVFLEVFDRLIAELTVRSDVAIAASGSLAEGNIDRWSDLDLEVIARPGVDLVELTAWTAATGRTVAPVLSHFPASHIGLDQILIFFYCQADTIVKADLYVLDLNDYLGLHATRLLIDPGGFVAARRETASPHAARLPNFEDLHNKFCGWIWYTFTKIARGELFEALNSLEVMRTLAVLPSIQIVEQLPFEGCRRVEFRVSEANRNALKTTVARSLEPSELRRALLAMARFFADLQPAVAARLGRDHQSAKLDSMIRHVEGLRLER